MYFNFVGIPKLLKCYSDQTYVNFVTDFAEGGNFCTYIRLNCKIK